MGTILATDEKRGLTATRTTTASHGAVLEVTNRAGDLLAVYGELAGVGWIEIDATGYQADLYIN